MTGSVEATIEKREQGLRFPDFIIGGAMKCGTTSLHHVLAAHPDVYIPANEIHLFDLDDPEQHADFFVYQNGSWIRPDFEEKREEYLQWYSDWFKPAAPGQLAGEDSTTYLASSYAAERIHRLLPRVKLIFMLRDPASRTYSHYGHLLRTGRATDSFEGMLQYSPHMLLQRSYYKRQLERYFNIFSREQILILLFEDFIRNMPICLQRVLDWLGLAGKIDLSKVDSHQNQAQVPRSQTLQVWRNRLFRSQALLLYQNHLPGRSEKSVRDRIQDNVASVLTRGFARINPLHSGAAPPMRPETRIFLNALLKKENRGLSELIGMDVEARWYRDP